MSTRWDLLGHKEALILLNKAEDIDMDGPEASAYNYLIDSLDEGLWNMHQSHEALRLWCLSCELIERLVKKEEEEKGKNES